MRFLASKNGTVHVVTKQLAGPRCPIVTRALNAGTWKGQRSIKPEEVSKYPDCAKCQSHQAARDLVGTVLTEFHKPKAGQPRKPLTGPDYRKGRPDNGGGSKRLKVASGPLPAVDAKTREKAAEHAALAEQHGWKVSIEGNDHAGLTVTASKGDESCVLTYREGGYLYSPGIVFVVPGRSVPLHNSGTWRRQVSLPDGKRPVSARPKRAGRIPKAKPEEAIHHNEVETGSEEVISLTRSSLPFPIDADDAEIIDHIRGRTLYWRNNMAAKVVCASLPSKPRLFRFAATRTGRRYVSFPELAGRSEDGEVLGAERSVAIEDMLRVK